MRILITGSRDWDDQGLIADQIHTAQFFYGEDLVVVHGSCPRGADQIADEWAAVLGIEVERHAADWDSLGRRAGFVRNAEMVALGADVCLAFIRNGSKGATHCADLAEKAGIPVRRFLA